MSSSLAQRLNLILLDNLFGGSGSLYMSLHTTDPGADGQGGGEATGTGYTRVEILTTDWSAAVANGSERADKVNGNNVVFPTAGGDWSSGVDFTWAAFWTDPSATDEIYFFARAPIDDPAPVLSGETPEFDAGSVKISLQ